MSIIVPQAEQQVKMREGQAIEPRISAAPAAAFGADVYEAKAKQGAAIQAGAEALSTKIASHMDDRNRANAEIAAYNTVNKFRDEGQQLLYSTDSTAKTGSDGKQYQIPNGLLNRNLTQATGAYTEYQSKMQGLKEKYLNGIQDPLTKRLFIQSADTQAASWGNSVLEHEAKQYRLNGEKEYIAQISNSIDDSAGVKNANELDQRVNHIAQVNAQLSQFRGDGKDVQDKNQDKYVADAVNKAAKHALYQTAVALSQSGQEMDIKAVLSDAMTVLESQKDKISLESYDKISKQLNDGADQLVKQTIKAKNDTEIGTTLKLIGDFTSGKKSWEDLNTIDNLPISGPTKMAFKSALGDKSIKPGKKLSGSVADTAAERPFANYIADIVNKNDQAGMIKEFNNALHGYGSGKISQERLDIIAKLVLQRAKNLPTNLKDIYAKKEGAAQAPDVTSAKQDAIDSGLKSLNDWTQQVGIDDPSTFKHYIDQTAMGADPKKAFDSATRATIVKHYPKAAAYDFTPHMIVDPNARSNFVFKGDAPSDFEPSRIYNPATKKIEPNPKAKKKPNAASPQ